MKKDEIILDNPDSYSMCLCHDFMKALSDDVSDKDMLKAVKELRKYYKKNIKRGEACDWSKSTINPSTAKRMGEIVDNNVKEMKYRLVLLENIMKKEF